MSKLFICGQMSRIVGYNMHTSRLSKFQWCVKIRHLGLCSSRKFRDWLRMQTSNSFR
jgi:hypothetical protein